jgi:hypothetical protein
MWQTRTVRRGLCLLCPLCGMLLWGQLPGLHKQGFRDGPAGVIGVTQGLQDHSYFCCPAENTASCHWALGCLELCLPASKTRMGSFSQIQLHSEKWHQVQAQQGPGAP